jgi:glucose-6-phosphate isomerase
MASSLDHAWSAVFDAAERLDGEHLADLVRSEPGRLAKLSLDAAGLHLDLAKQPFDLKGLDALLALARAADVEGARGRLFSGVHVNGSEDRPALHMALRGSISGVTAWGEDVAKFSSEARAAAKAFAASVRKGARKGATGLPLTQILHIGIGGSDLGPRLVCEALSRDQDPSFTLRFAGNVDPAEINDALAGLDPETTLVIVVSKSMTTQETKLNFDVARAWLAARLGDKAGQHIVAVTAKPERAKAFGVADDAIFPFRDWVGGRFSVWSSVSLALDIGLKDGAIDAFHAGGKAMDQHFATAPLERNAPVLMALAEVWNRNVLDRGSRCVAPYARRLRLLPSFLQQLEMESNGKGVTVDGGLAGPTSPVVWGAEGTNAQHAFFQQLHQGPDVVPVDFIGVLEDSEARPELHKALLANLFAQGAALMAGDPGAALPHKRFPGGRPSTTILLPRLDAASLGALIALYEHKVYVAATLWGINPFDQWGVELGKVIAGDILKELEGGPAGARDPSTADMIARARKALK